MPSHNIHLAIARKINKILNLNLDEFMLGNILPDIVCKEHRNTHFCPDKPGIKGITRPEEFYKKYKDKMNNTIMIGYLIHLLTDKFYNEYIFKNFFIYDENGDDKGLIINGKKIFMDKKEIKKIKHQELYNYGKWLLNNNYVSKFKSVLCINKVINIEEFNYDKEIAIKYIIDHNDMMDKNKKLKILNIFRRYKFKLSSKNKWDKKFIECCNFIERFLRKKKIIKNKLV